MVCEGEMTANSNQCLWNDARTYFEKISTGCRTAQGNSYSPPRDETQGSWSGTIRAPVLLLSAYPGPDDVEKNSQQAYRFPEQEPGGKKGVLIVCFLRDFSGQFTSACL